MIILKHRFFWILNLYHLLKEEVFFFQEKGHDFYANILNVRNKRYLKNLILSIWY